MFERIRCYVGTKKADKALYGIKQLGEVTNDEYLINVAEASLRSNANLRGRMWKNRTLAKNYNLEMKFKGFDKIF